MYAQSCLRRIPVDLVQAAQCLAWAREASPMPDGCVWNVSVHGMVNSAEFYRMAVMRPGKAGREQPPNPNFLGWAGESIWWVRETCRDAVRAAWHVSMSNHYQSATNHPADPLASGPPELYPDL
jgi:hypothetical protein